MIDRKVAPLHTEIKHISLPRAQNFSLNNHLPVTILNGVNQDVIKIDVVFTASKWNEPLPGAAHFTSTMLEKGTTKMNAFQIADFFDRYGASIEIYSGFDFTTLSLYTLSKNLNQTLPTFIELFTDSVFPENELNILKSHLIQNLKINNEKTSYIAGKVFRQQIFGPHHPYGSSLEEAEIAELTTVVLRNYFKNNFKPCHVFVTGNIDSPIQNHLSKEFSSITLNNQKSDDYKVTIKSETLENKIHIEKQASTQTSIRIGKRTINRSHENYPALVLLNHMLGGFFGSRLMKNIREEKGLTYGIYSSINALKNDSYLVIGADVNKVNKDLAVSEIKNEINKLITDKIDSAEFKIAKSHLLGSLQLELASPFSVIEKIKTVQLYQLPEEFYSNLFQQIYSFQSNEIHSIAESLFSAYYSEVTVG